MNLCIDQGNSRTKVAVFNAQGQIVEDWIFRSKTFSASDIDKIVSGRDITASIISSVINIDPAIVNYLHRHTARFVLFDHNTPLPIRNSYATPQTLGQDRIAAAIGANGLYPQQNVLVIDVGSAITVDFLTAQGEFLGGNIAPGMKMRLRALKYFTGKLPRVDVDEQEPVGLYGDTTRTAIVAGVVNGITFEIEGYIRAAQQQYGQIQTVLTGGNAAYYQRRMSVAVGYEKHLVLIGLNRILEMQDEKK